MNYLLVNPAAGNGNGHASLRELLDHHDIQVEPVTDAALREALPGPGDRLIVVGGDGTVSRTASYCIAHGCALGLIPTGTGNDFARGLGIPLEPAAACEVLAQGNEQVIDVCRANEHIYLNVLHAGLGSEVTRAVDDDDKRRLGRLSYARRLLDRCGDARGFRGTIECNGARVRGRWVEIAVANGSSFGGGTRVFEANPLDGELDVIAVRPRLTAHLFKLWLLARVTRRVPDDPAVVYLRGPRCSISDCKPRQVTADGELVGATPLHIEVLPQALRVCVPPAPAAASRNDRGVIS
ncbi:MAG: diacylglycerol kinase family lipid kinase [Gammaproteobacteria bacterium]